MSYDDSSDYTPDLPPQQADLRAAREQVQMPAIFLIIVGVLNILLSMGGFGFGFMFSRLPPEDFELRMMHDYPERWKEMQAQGWTIQEVINLYVYGGVGGGAMGFLVAILIIIGGARMLVLKSYGLAFFASILTLIPFISCSACCGLGEGIGIWALVVLMNEQVKAAFS